MSYVWRDARYPRPNHESSSGRHRGADICDSLALVTHWASRQVFCCSTAVQGMASRPAPARAYPLQEHSLFGARTSFIPIALGGFWAEFRPDLGTSGKVGQLRMRLRDLCYIPAT